MLMFVFFVCLSKDGFSRNHLAAVGADETLKRPEDQPGRQIARRPQEACVDAVEPSWAALRQMLGRVYIDF